MRLIILLIATLLIGCGSDDKPANLIEQDKMVKVLADIHEAEASVNNMHLGNQDTTIMVYQRLRWKVMKKNQTDTAAFSVSLKYYILNPKVFKNIYEEVKIELENRRKAVPSTNPTPVDTLKKIPRNHPVKHI